MNALDCKISFFNNCRYTGNPINTGTFFQVVTSEKLCQKYGPLVDLIRSTTDKKERKPLKEKLPCFTPSGTFGERTAAGLIEPSGLLSFDLDAGANPFLNAGTVEDVKAEFCKLPEVAFCQTSASGTGLWGVVQMAHPERHAEQFEALEKAFAQMGYKIDPACSDVCRLRFWSYDPAPYFNLNARPFTGLPKRIPQPLYTQSRGHLAGPPPDDLPAQAAAYLVQNRVPLECSYSNFMRIAFACKITWGESGKDTALDILHACTTFATSNTARKFDTLWRNIHRENGVTATAGTLVHLAKEHGFKYTITHTHHAPTTPDTAPDAATWQAFTTKDGKAYEQRMEPEGYPALWDDLRPAPEAIAANIRDNAAKLCEAAGWTKVGNWQPMTSEDFATWERRMKHAQEVTNSL